MFFRSPYQQLAAHVTQCSGIGDILPNAQVDDFLFDPCGYSMNGLLGDTFITIHVTPEDGQSYASVEVYAPSGQLPSKTALLARVQAVFDSARATLAV